MNIRLIAFTICAAGILGAAEADFGLIGVSSFETARLTADCDGSVVPCEVTFEFHDIQGRTLKQTTLTIQPGASAFVDFSPGTAFLSGGPVQINPCWKVIRGAAFGSLELFDNFTQRTRMLINFGDRPAPRRASDVDFALAGITPLDTARLAAYCSADQVSRELPPDPCDIHFVFHSVDGRVLKESRMTLQPGTGGFLDLKWVEAAATSRRVEIDPCWTIERGAAVGSFMVVDNLTGLTTAIGYPAALVTAE